MGRVLGACALALGLLFGGVGLPVTRAEPAMQSAMHYRVGRLRGPITIDARWDKPAWRQVAALTLAHFMGDRPEHLPVTQAKLQYDEQNLYVIFRVRDRYVRAVARRHQDSVCRDSCVEFFFVPGGAIKTGYFNLEMNCGGTMLLHFQVIPRQGAKPLVPAELDRIEVAHSMPRIVEPEIEAPTVWTVEYRMPFDLVDAYYPHAVRPAPGASWRANFFKCADDTSHPHWLTWAKVDRPQPDFHVPECFGTLVFE